MISYHVDDIIEDKIMRNIFFYILNSQLININLLSLLVIHFIKGNCLVTKVQKTHFWVFPFFLSTYFWVYFSKIRSYASMKDRQ